MKHLIVLLVAALSTGCAGMVKDALKVVDDPMSKNIEFNTLAYDFPILTRGNRVEEHFRGYINRSTKKVSLTLYATVIHYQEYAHWSTVKYAQGDRIVEQDLGLAGGLVTNTSVSCSKYGPCAFHEDVVLSLDRDTLLYWAEHGAKIRFISDRVSTTRELEIQPEEVKIFLGQLDQAMLLAGI